MMWLLQAFSFSGEIPIARYFGYWLFSWALIGGGIGTFIVTEGAGLSFLLFLLGYIGGPWVNLASTVKRMRDAGLSFWNLLWPVVPFIGGLILLFLLLTTPSKWPPGDPDPETNEGT